MRALCVALAVLALQWRQLPPPQRQVRDAKSSCEAVFSYLPQEPPVLCVAIVGAGLVKFMTPQSSEDDRKQQDTSTSLSSTLRQGRKPPVLPQLPEENGLGLRRKVQWHAEVPNTTVRYVDSGWFFSGTC